MSVERIDHAAEARRVIAEGEHASRRAREEMAKGYPRLADGYGAKAHGCWMQAQVHATLALVEQQRIANLMTLIGDDEPDDVNEVLAGLGVDPASVKDDVVAAMGWS